jgi:hypothetical protein
VSTRFARAQTLFKIKRAKRLRMSVATLLGTAVTGASTGRCSHYLRSMARSAVRPSRTTPPRRETTRSRARVGSTGRTSYPLRRRRTCRRLPGRRRSCHLSRRRPPGRRRSRTSECLRRSGQRRSGSAALWRVEPDAAPGLRRRSGRRRRHRGRRHCGDGCGRLRRDGGGRHPPTGAEGDRRHERAHHEHQRGSQSYRLPPH